MRIQEGAPLFASSSVNLAATASSGGGANAVVNLAASTITDPSQWSIRNVLVSYNASGTGGLNVYKGTSSGALMTAVDITSAGVRNIDFGGLSAPPGNAMAIELLQAGSSVVGRLNVYARRL